MRDLSHSASSTTLWPQTVNWLTEARFTTLRATAARIRLDPSQAGLAGRVATSKAGRLLESAASPPARDEQTFCPQPVESSPPPHARMCIIITSDQDDSEWRHGCARLCGNFYVRPQLAWLPCIGGQWASGKRSFLNDSGVAAGTRPGREQPGVGDRGTRPWRVVGAGRSAASAAEAAPLPLSGGAGRSRTAPRWPGSSSCSRPASPGLSCPRAWSAARG
jgi:hypothetical protein